MRSLEKTRWFGITYFMIALLVVFAVAIDIFVSFGVPTAPEEVGRAICAMRPLSFFGTALIRRVWVDYINAQCAGYPVEPAISIIGFTIKASLAVIVIAIVVGVTTVIEQTKEPNLPLATDDTSKSQRALVKMKSLIGPTITWIGLGVGCWVALISAPPQQFHYWAAGKIIQDMLILIVMMAAILTCEFLNAVGHWMRLSIARE